MYFKNVSNFEKPYTFLKLEEKASKLLFEKIKNLKHFSYVQEQFLTLIDKLEKENNIVFTEDQENDILFQSLSQMREKQKSDFPYKLNEKLKELAIKKLTKIISDKLLSANNKNLYKLINQEIVKLRKKNKISLLDNDEQNKLEENIKKFCLRSFLQNKNPADKLAQLNIYFDDIKEVIREEEYKIEQEENNKKEFEEKIKNYIKNIISELKNIKPEKGLDDYIQNELKAKYDIAIKQSLIKKYRLQTN